jgi:hypothetical protein
MVDVFFFNVFNPKIIHHQCEGDGAGEMPPEAWGMRTFVILMGEESLPEQFVGYDSCLWESPYGAAHFKVHKPILCMCVQIVLLTCPWGGEGEWHLHVFKTIKGGGLIEMFDVQAHVAGAFGAKDAVPHQF